MQGNLRFKVDWASLIVGRKFTVLLCFTLYVRAISKCKLRGAYIWRCDLTEGFLRYEFGGLIHGEAYFRNFTVYVCIAALYINTGAGCLLNQT